MKKLFNNNQSSVTSLSELIYQLMSCGYRVELHNNHYSLFSLASKRPMEISSDKNSVADLLRSIQQGAIPQFPQSNAEYALAFETDRTSFENYANALIKEFKSRTVPEFKIGTLVTHKNGFGVLAYSTKGLILDLEYDITNKTYFYLVEYYASYVSQMTDGKPVAVKCVNWIPEIALGKEPFKTDIDESVAKLLEE